MNQVLGKLEPVAQMAVDQLQQALSVGPEMIVDKGRMKDSLAILREYGRLYSAQTARANVAVKMAGALGLRKDDLMPVWRQLTGSADSIA